MPDSTAPRWAQGIAALGSALPCFYVSWILLKVWRDPMSVDDGNWVRFGVGLLVLEFLLLHSGAFISAMIASKDNFAAKAKLLLGLFLFYGLMVWSFAMSFDSMALLWIFAGVSLGRLLSAGINNSPGSESAEGMNARSALGIALYLLVAFGTVFLPIPEWGIDRSVLDEVYPNRGGGLWERQPQRAIAGAAAYFALLGLAELFILGPFKKNSSKSARLDQQIEDSTSS